MYVVLLYNIIDLHEHGQLLFKKNQNALRPCLKKNQIVVSHIQRIGCQPEKTTLGRPGSSEVPRNPLTRWDVSSIPANGIFLTKKLKNKIKMPHGWRTIKSLVHKI